MLISAFDWRDFEFMIKRLIEFVAFAFNEGFSIQFFILKEAHTALDLPPPQSRKASIIHVLKIELFACKVIIFQYISANRIKTSVERHFNQ